MTPTTLTEGHGFQAVHHLVDALAAAPNLQAVIYREAIAGLTAALGSWIVPRSCSSTATE